MTPQNSKPHDPESSPNNISPKDTLFQQPQSQKFAFDEKVANVFDDMLERSIPYYRDTQKLCVDFLAHFASSGRIYDLGCSTGNMLLALRERISGELIGLDSSPAMVEKARAKASAYGAAIEFVCADIMDFAYERAQGAIANYTLQFIRPPLRLKLLARIHAALESSGVLLLSEKTISHSALLDSALISYYHRYKASNGYTKGEIATKREALENVLVPYSLEENLALLREAGFAHVEVLFKWANFATFIAVK